MDVSIIIVNYNTKELTRNCLKSIYEHTYDIDFEVIVSDNGSTDGSIEMIKSEFPQVILIENKVNLGFGAANNRGLKIAKGKYVFYLNSDTILLNNAVKMFFDYWENSPEKETIGALGALLLGADGTYTHSYGDFPTYKKQIYGLFGYFLDSIRLKKIIKKILKIKKSEFKTGAVGYITGADLFLKNNETAFYDEHFFMYFEETDLQLRLLEHGLNRLIISGPKIVHLCGGSDGANNKYYSFSKKSSIYYWISCIYYFSKNSFSTFKLILLQLCIVFIWIMPWNIKICHSFVNKVLKIKSI